MRSRVALALAVALAGRAHAADNPAAALEAPAVQVIGTTPLPGIGTPVEQVPANVQTLTDRDLRDRPLPGVVEALESDAASFTVNQSQGNPYLPDVNFRGFAASPLLGTPQGVSVYQDGVRVNEAFGDVVNWDLIPRIAVSSIQVIPGSNPIFGLNTLGGAIALYTKSGFAYPGSRIATYGGSFGRFGVEAETGGFRGEKDWYAAANVMNERGWRDYSRSEIAQFFGKVGHEDDRNDLDVSLSLADTSLSGTQALPLSMLGSPKQPYTWPDRTENRLAFVNAKGSRLLTPEHLLAANLYVRDLRTRNNNSNVNDECEDAPCAFTAINDASTIDETRVGGALQYTGLAALAGRKNQLVLGLALDWSRTDFLGESQEANFNATREAIGSSPFTTDTNVRTHQRQASVYVTDTIAVTERVFLTGSASYNLSSVTIGDRSGTQPALTGKHSFGHFLPAAGIAYSPARGEAWYANASSGMRAPTAIELTCADPAAPCRLPNVFLADPPLNPVLSRTFEAGLRKPLGERVGVTAAVFRTELRDDIQFISTSGAAINAGYFQNVGRTRRDGIELGLDATVSRLTVGARYGYVDATFESGFTAASGANSSADAAGDIQVRPGDRIPGIPRHSFKLRLGYAITDAIHAGATLLAFSSQYARGDENNQDANGPVPGYTVVNLDARWDFAPGWRVFASINNLFDRRYATFGVLGENFFTGPGNAFDAANVRAEQFRTPGAPFGAWIGIAYSFGAGPRDGQAAREQP